MAENSAGEYNPDEVKEEITAELEDLRDIFGRLPNTPEALEVLGQFIHESLLPPDTEDLGWAW